MTEYSDIHARAVTDLRRTEAELVEARERVTSLEEKAARLRGFLITLEEYAEVDDSAMADVSLKEAVHWVLQHSQGGMTAPDIAGILLNEGYPYEHDRETLEKSIRGVLSRGARDDEIEKLERGVYALPGIQRSEGNLFEEDSPETEQPSGTRSGSGVAGPSPSHGLGG